MVFFLFFLGLLGCSRGGPAIFAIAIHPQKSEIVYASTRQHVYKTRDGGETWSLADEGLNGIGVIAFGIDPALPSTVYAGTFANAVFKSPDGGQRWFPANIGLKEHVSVVNAFVFDPRDTRTVYAGTTVGVYKSTNGGEEWVEKVHGFESVYAVALKIAPDNPEIIYVGTTGGVYRSLDGAERWQQINRGLFEEGARTAMSLGVNSIDIDPVEPRRVFIGTTQGVYVSEDGGLSWRNQTDGLTSRHVANVAISPADRKVLYAGTADGVFRSDDRAATWHPSGQGITNGVIRALAIDRQKPETLFVGTQGGLFRSRDGGRTWVLLKGLR